MQTVLKFACCFRFRFRFVCVYLCLTFSVFFNVSLDHFIPALLTFVVLGFVSSVSAAKRLAGKTSLK